MSAVVTGTPTHIVASSREQAEVTFEVAKALLNDRGPKGTALG